MWSVALSEVQARSEPEGLKASEKTVAGSMPRRSSVTLAQLLVAWTRIIVPFRPRKKEKISGLIHKTYNTSLMVV